MFPLSMTTNDYDRWGEGGGGERQNDYDGGGEMGEGERMIVEERNEEEYSVFMHYCLGIGEWV